MAGCRLTALLVCLFVLTGGSQGFTVEPAKSDLYVRIGGDAEFTVRPSNPIESGNWVFKGKTPVSWVATSSSIIAEYRSRVNLNFTSGSLVLRSVNESDNGDYRVTLTAVGGAQASATITLKAFEVIDKPTITANNSRPVELSDAVTLTCEVTWKANHFEWFQWNKTIHLVDRTTLGQDNKTLTISGVLRSDEGFTCLASDGNNSRTSDPYKVDAVYGPDSVSITIIPERSMHAVGATVIFTCSVVANHELDFHWYHDNSTVQGDGQQLIIAGLFLNHTGNYTCSASSGTTRKEGLATTSIVVIEPVSQPLITSNDTRSVEHNDTVTLACAAVGTDVSYAWSRNGLALSPGGRLVLSNGNRTLTISGVLRSDKEFTCTGSNPVNTNTSDPFLLDVSYGPESVNISVSPEQAAHISGTNASLTCSAVSKPAPEYQWFFNGLFQESGQQLFIAALDVNDTGSYTCQVFNNVTIRSSSSSRNIAVIEPVSAPNITSNASSFIEYNDTAVLACVAAGTDVSYTWLEDNSVIPNGDRLELSASNTTLTITGVLRSDGPFTCRASNPVSVETSGPFHLNVFYGPDLPIIIPDPDTPVYTSGTDVTLTCSAESKPATVMRWYRQGDVVQSGDQLTIPNVSNEDIGSYVCQAFNNMTRRYRASSILIDVQERVANVSLRSNNSDLVEDRDPVLLTCSSQGTQLKREWLFNNQPIQQNNRINISGNTLLIDPVNRNDTGVYKCTVSNGLNSGSAEKSLVIYYGPDNMYITPPGKITIKKGNDLKLTCSAQSMPSPVYVWYNGVERLSEGPEFTISPVSKEHSGKYTCHVNNARTGRNNSLTAEVIVVASGLGAGAIAGIVIVVIVVGGGIGGGTAHLIRTKMNRTKAEPGTKYDANRSPRGQTTSATDAGNGLGTYENLPGNKQGITHAPEGDSTYMTRERDVIYIRPQIVGPNAKPSGEIVIDDQDWHR